MRTWWLWAALLIACDSRSAPATPVVGRMKVGDVGTLAGFGGGPTAYLFEDRVDFDALRKAVLAKDLVGARQASVSAVEVQAGTTAIEIEDDAFAGGAIRVRVVGGPRADYAGWTFAGSLTR